MKDITTPVPPEEMKKVVQKCLEKAAGINYSQLIDYAQIKGDAIIVNNSRRLSSLIFHENLKGLSSQEQDTMCFNHQLRFMGNVVLAKCLDVCLGPPVDPQAPPEKRLEDMMRLGELCIEVLQQNDEHHSEVF